MEYLGRQFDGTEKEIVDSVVDSYKDWTGGQLITLMHKDGTPWSRHYVEGCTGTVIPDDTTEEYYTGLVRERQQYPHAR